MLNEVEDEFNDESFRNRRYKYIYKYISKERKKRRIKEYLLRLDSEVYSEFRRIAAAKFGLHYGANVLVEALMKIFIEEFKDAPIIQTTLFYKPKVNVHTPKVELNIAQKLEIKIVKQDLTAILESLEQGRGDRGWLLSKLREVLGKAIRVYEKTSDGEIERLLEKAEKWIEKR